MASLLAVELRERVAHVAIAAKTGVSERFGGPAVEQPLRATGIPIHHVARPQQKPLELLRSSMQLARVLRAERPDVVHAHNPAAAAAVRLARLVARHDAPIVATYHGVRPTRVSAAVRTLRFGADAIVGVGPTSTRALADAGLPARRLATVFNAVPRARPTRQRAEMRRELGIPEDAELVVSVGRYEPEKDQATLLDALARILPERPRLHALLVGHGGLEGDLRAQAERLGIAGRARVIGGRADAVDVMASADVFALSSVWESLPLVLLEAMLVGTAVVTTRAGGVTDVARDGETAIVVPVGDAEALGRAIAGLLDDAALRERLTTAAAEFVEANCSPEAMADGYIRVYLDAVARRAPQPSSASPKTSASIGSKRDGTTPSRPT